MKSVTVRSIRARWRGIHHLPRDTVDARQAGVATRNAASSKFPEVFSAI
jgi:hypothetical protein